MVLLAQIQLHMLSQNTAATTALLSACTVLFAAGAQSGQATQLQPLWSQLQLHFCVLRALVLLTEGRYAELSQAGIASCRMCGSSAALHEQLIVENRTCTVTHRAPCLTLWQPVMRIMCKSSGHA